MSFTSVFSFCQLTWSSCQGFKSEYYLGSITQQRSEYYDCSFALGMEYEEKDPEQRLMSGYSSKWCQAVFGIQ